MPVTPLGIGTGLRGSLTPGSVSLLITCQWNSFGVIFSFFLLAGSLYKSFVANTLTTVEDVLVQALKKANMSDQDPDHFCITETVATPNGQ